ncbi:6-bladed beta-propeller [Chondrinema litorale]|uniref:6-bladed beta-propeller n=1 Tax=Chondrinema litorale TaxID=2994555 RepID=UPI002542A042|nr:6-bladed beta-propeller [Chondrinema litorale]UZR97336.1 6-bladed beta-propeller [Chondrinema litorale]
MKVLSFLITTCFLFFTNIYTENSAENPYAPNENTIKLDISKAITETEPFLSKLKITKVVKLKGDVDTYISSSRKIIDRDNKIYICDYEESNLSIFDYEGNYVSKVGGKGRGPGEFDRIFDFTILDDGRFVVIDRKGLMLFDKNKQHVSSKYHNPSLICQWPDNKFVVFFDATKYARSSSNLIIYDTNYKVIDELFPYPEETKTNTAGFFGLGGIVNTPSGILLNEASSPIFYEIHKDGNSYPKYEITGNSKIWPHEDRYKLKAFAKETNDGIAIYPAYPFRENNNAFVFSLVLEDKKMHTFFYDKIENKLYQPDLLNEPYLYAFFRTVFGFGVNQKNEFIIPVYMNKLYRKLNKDETLKTDMAKYFPELLTLAEGTDEYSNPALVYFTFGE